MEKYINNETIIKNDIYEAFKDVINCSICQNILIDPVMCMNCQNNFCKKCIEKQNICSHCREVNFRKSIGKQDILSKLTFKCKECGKKYLYDEAERHHCINNLNSNQKITKLSEQEIKELKEKGIEVTNISSKKK